MNTGSQNRRPHRRKSQLFLMGMLATLVALSYSDAQEKGAKAPQEVPQNAKNGQAEKDKKKDDEKPKNEDKKKDEDKDKEKEKEKLPPAITGDTTLNLQECLAIALDRGKRIKAAQISLRASELGSRSLVNLSPLARRLTPDLCFRQQQSERGLLIARADVLKAQYETMEDVTRLYFTVVYARQQEATATDIIDQMDVFYGIAKDLVEQGAQPKLNRFSLYRMSTAITEVKKPRITARIGQQQALAALKEAMGVEQSYSFLPRDVELPIMGGTITQEQVVAFATSRRPELTLAAAGLDAFRLEVMAQAAVQRRQKVPTLASGSDLHARTIPAALRNGQYKPGAISPEMPPNLVGKREDRTARAQEYSNRQETVYEATVKLVELEAINAALTWQATTERLKLAKVEFERGQEMVELSRSNAPNIREYDQLVVNEAYAAKAQAEYLEAVFEHVKALAILERVTTGGVKADFPQR